MEQRDVGVQLTTAIWYNGFRLWTLSLWVHIKRKEQAENMSCLNIKSYQNKIYKQPVLLNYDKYYLFTLLMGMRENTTSTHMAYRHAERMP